MLDYDEFQNEKKVSNNLQIESKKKLGRLKKKKLLVKFNQFNKKKQEPKNITILPDVGGKNYYDSYK